MTNFPIRMFEDRAVLRTDEQSGVYGNNLPVAEVIFDPTSTPTQLPQNQHSHTRTFHQFSQLETELEFEDPSKAVQDAYTDH